jgi:hypothetical protein
MPGGALHKNSVGAVSDRDNTLPMLSPPLSCAPSASETPPTKRAITGGLRPSPRRIFDRVRSVAAVRLKDALKSRHLGAFGSDTPAASAFLRSQLHRMPVLRGQLLRNFVGGFGKCRSRLVLLTQWLGGTGELLLAPLYATCGFGLVLPCVK